ncbi:hypothetical protein ACB371_24010, partial [Klebsiella pneumoniae]
CYVRCTSFSYVASPVFNRSNRDAFSGFRIYRETLSRFSCAASLTMLAAMTTGSGNAPFYAFVEMIPKLAHSSGINPAYLSIPMLQASNLGRTISPVSGVVVAVAGMAKISPFEVVKRTSVPVLVGLLVVIVATEILVPGSALH